MTTIKNDVVYDKEHNLTTDIYLPNDPSTKKVLIFWHGGGWIRGDKADVKDLGKKFADAGYTAFIPNYRLAPKDTFPAAHEDTVTFVKWLLDSEYADSEGKNVVQIGASSGGVMALYIAGKYGFPTVTWSAPVNYSEWMKEHENTTASVDAKNELGLTDAKAINESFYKYFGLAYAGQNDPAVLKQLDASSYNYDNLGSLWLINSADELSPLKYVLDFIQDLAKQNRGSELTVIPGTQHAMAYANEYLAASLAYLKTMSKN
ncbi:alpha/beta hydrolase [Lactobacillus sp. ESL0791]|uniref:alpha/beta hydrolase n=1 Tax=Lactobacillus sp. ESL0791 TaxID=2983234 RepID=UPI0023F8E517|nr:alpha/beta hydrolase [Lactobacillus sp. ESL0791]MDF7638230.1 alpha/beta hydrolase [Lactobacillus sp. ESL0791]